MNNLTKGEHAIQLVYLYTHPSKVLHLFYSMGEETEEASNYLKMLSSKSPPRTFVKEPYLIIEWYNLQFGTDFTLEQIKKLTLLY